MHKSLDEFEFRPDRTTDYGVSCPWASKKYPYRPYNGENGVSTFSLLFLIRSFWYFHVTRTSIKAWMSSNFLKWDLTLAHWTQVSDRCPLGYLLLQKCRVSYVVEYTLFEPQHDKTNKMTCAPSELRSAWAFAESDQSSLCAQWVAKDPSFFSCRQWRLIRLVILFFVVLWPFCKFCCASAEMRIFIILSLFTSTYIQLSGWTSINWVAADLWGLKI